MDDATTGLLTNHRRRYVLSYLDERAGEPVSVDALASQVIARELVMGSGSVDPDSVEVTLAHVHLPKLAAAGVIEYDRDAATVRRRLDDTDVVLEERTARVLEGSSA
ncbi:DUF7344 domain-containing protein [Halomarina ordinaria]|uniref:DUF7344 domain-containing protein n=1 Tax=Halomarina ordinaria TaxID=3033939 RepID=A0ABD5U7X2_9EURY|nr:hypothetical protein [Halomarina sp. PSRA2]